MSSPTLTFDPITAIGYIGQTVLVELVWEGDPEPIWRFKHIVGVVVPVQGVNEVGYFLTLPVIGSADFPDEIYFDSIHTIRAIRDRHAPAKVLDRLPLPHLFQGQAKEGERRHA
ncbi:hypothetical protein [Pseudomonas sihuiensis]|uniref:Uncharacterized protein n=1 Tax=Pseudomonas sihuiensis TaxID=1274359 RepID=A0A1H2L511_9PSED|nr:MULTISPECIES: hypothetical protein [Pseudomonas]MDH1868947.1 hypothetical protein [Pseudomonas chengduensis]SDU76110.1 hypothetical protein SAMN05216363_0212 [Pseudomonas sihuiensis]